MPEIVDSLASAEGYRVRPVRRSVRNVVILRCCRVAIWFGRFIIRFVEQRAVGAQTNGEGGHVLLLVHIFSSAGNVVLAKAAVGRCADRVAAIAQFGGTQIGLIVIIGDVRKRVCFIEGIAVGQQSPCGTSGETVERRYRGRARTACVYESDRRRRGQGAGRDRGGNGQLRVGPRRGEAGSSGSVVDAGRNPATQCAQSTCAGIRDFGGIQQLDGAGADVGGNAAGVGADGLVAKRDRRGRWRCGGRPAVHIADIVAVKIIGSVRTGFCIGVPVAVGR